MTENSKLWNEVLNSCRYFRHHNCCKPFNTGSRRAWNCPTPYGCCFECDKVSCPTRCKKTTPMNTEELK